MQSKGFVSHVRKLIRQDLSLARDLSVRFGDIKSQLSSPESILKIDRSLPRRHDSI